MLITITRRDVENHLGSFARKTGQDPRGIDVMHVVVDCALSKIGGSIVEDKWYRMFAAGTIRVNEQGNEFLVDVPETTTEGAGSHYCAACKRGLDWWSRAMVASSGVHHVTLGTLGDTDQPQDFAGVCAKCEDGFCLSHAPDHKCPNCGGELITGTGEQAKPSQPSDKQKGKSFWKRLFHFSS